MSVPRSSGYIELNRSFRKLLDEAYKDDNQRFNLLAAQGSSLPWGELLKLRRVVILSEAGSGKTMEIREASYRLRSEGKAAFFLRLESISNGIEEAFEVGAFEEFQEWLASSEEAWLFLDSVDESRLKNPKDFEQAVRVVSKTLSHAGARVHIVLTSRANAWRPYSDLRLCEKYLPWMPSVSFESSDDQSSSVRVHQTRAVKESEGQGLQFFTLEDLNSTQVVIFAKDRGIEDAETFLDALKAVGAEAFASRPLDLDELLRLWGSEKRIGSRRELVRNSIESRLREIDPDRAVSHPLDLERTRQAVKSMAAATTLIRNQEISVPDRERSRHGISIEAILPDWNERDSQALLSRPIFDEEIYGTVRFHHRSTREYLTAEWFSDLLKKDASRRNVEALFFREKYGEKIVTPGLRPILPWLSLKNDRICQAVQRWAPEIFLEGGDPSGLSGNDRCSSLRYLCERISQGIGEKWPGDPEFVALFAQKDLTESVCQLLAQYAQNDAVVEFLLLLVVKGRLSGAWADVERIIRSGDRSHGVRKWAWLAANAAGSDEQLHALRTWYLESSSEIDRDILSSLLERLPSSDEAIQWLLTCLESCPPEKKNTYDGLKYELPKYVERVDVDRLPALIDGFEYLLGLEPLIVEHEFKKIWKFGWLIEPACRAVIRLIQQRNPAAMEPGVLAVLLRFEDLYHHHEYDLGRKILPGLVAGWPELNRTVFWAEVKRSRKRLESQAQARLTTWWQVNPRNLWAFRTKSFPTFVQEIADRELMDDKMVAVSFAFTLCQQEGLPSDWVALLERSVRIDQELIEHLERFLTPTEETPADKENRDYQERWKREEEARKLEETHQLEKAREYFTANLEALRAAVAENPADLHNDVCYLFQVCQEKDSNYNHRAVTDWKALEPEFGREVAQFFHDSAVGFWRNHAPQLRSEGAPPDKVTYAVLVGLTGLAIESKEDPTWMDSLTHEQVERACRFASFEGNGFPEWLPALFERFRDVVGQFLLQEIRYELSMETAENGLHHIIQTLSWSGQWAWDWLASSILEILSSSEPSNQATLDSFLKIVHGSRLNNDSISKLAAKKCQSGIGVLERLASWCAVWVGSDPINGLEFFKKTLEERVDPNVRTEFAMHFITRLVGGWRRANNVVAREAFREPQYLKELYLLVHRHIRVEDDPDRSERGAYSPGLRDHAQDARNAIFGLLEQIPGRETYMAICDIANQAHQGHARSWILQRAKAKAEQDGDLAPWSPEQVREFQEELERTPTNHKELAELIRLRLLDLKDDWENGDQSIAGVLLNVQETDVRNVICDVLRKQSRNRYTVVSEEELADAKRPDLRINGIGFDEPVPIELKLANRWRGHELMERFENQLCGDYLRDRRSSCGIFLLVNQERGWQWNLASRETKCNFPELVAALQEQWESIKASYPNVEKIDVIGIDLTERKS